MNKEKIIPLAKGIIKHVPGVKRFIPNKTGGTTKSRYCYSVWMRHLKFWNEYRPGIPGVVAELGPGDSLGTGFAALLSGCKRLYALDVIKYSNSTINLKIFDELVDLFIKRSSIPDNNEYPEIRPKLKDYAFPSDILTEQILNESLDEKRINSIRDRIMDIENPQKNCIKCSIPWHEDKVIEKNSIDFIFSQAVLQHVEDIENTYAAMSKWLKPSGLMSHTIDLKCMGTSKIWNGHYTYSDFEWNLIKGGRMFLINRVPYSRHIELHCKYGFETLKEIVVKRENTLTKKYLSSRYKNLTEDDITTSGIYMLSLKKE